MSKIFWTNEEQAQLHAKMVELFRSTPLLRKEQALEAAQTTLPAERRRKLYPSAVYRWRSLVEDARKVAKDQPQEPSKVAEAPVAPADPLAGLLDQLLDVLADKIAAKLADRVQLQVSTTTHTTTRHDPAPTQTAAPKRPSVLIVGLLGGQCHTIKNNFAHRLDISCLTAEEAKSRPALHKENTILMTKFLNHATQTKYRRHPGLRLCNGGISELSALLKEV